MSFKLTEEHRTYLDGLRESGEVNMMGSGVYVQDEFDVDRHEAKLIVLSWMREKEGRDQQNADN